MKDFSFGIIPIWNDNGVNRFLLVQSKIENEWSFPKGHPEAGETEIQSALRELREETGITYITFINNISYSDKYSFELDGQKIDKTVKLFVGKVTDPKVTIQEKEIANYKWATYDEALATISFDEPKEFLKDLVNKIKNGADFSMPF
jgi:tRNA nucleotidyltransferase (CCA-adding enzyme)